MTRAAAVLAVGDELLLGAVVNTNAAWLGRALAACGVPVVSSAMVGDDLDRIVAALRRGLAEADVLVVTGGLGPTSDDRTREALALLAGVPLERSAELERQLREHYRGAVSEPVLRQADVPRGATALPNQAGTAPGLRLVVEGRVVVALPGPPHELRAVFEDGVRAELQAGSGGAVLTRAVRTTGRGESAVAGAVEAAVPVPAGVDLAYLADAGGVAVRFTGRDASLLDALAQAAAAALGPDVWGYDEQTLPEVVQHLLAADGATVGVAESLTGGLLGAALSALPGSSATFRGGVLVYATDLKASLAGVPADLLAAHGPVAAQTALALARGARERTASTYGLATTGVAGPTGQDGQAVGTVFVAVDGPAGTVVRELHLPGEREQVRLRTVAAALDLLRRTVLDSAASGTQRVR